MAEWKKLTKEEFDALDPKEILNAEVAKGAEAEAQGVCRCPNCSALLTVPGTPAFVRCCVCGDVFAVTWF